MDTELNYGFVGNSCSGLGLFTSVIMQTEIIERGAG